MILSDKIVAAYVEGFSGVYIDCPKDKIDEIASEFNSKFEEAWTQAMDDAEEDYDAVCQEKEDEMEAPATAMNAGDRIYVNVEPLYLSMNYGARADNEYGTAALENTLKQLKEAHPEITYEGVIAYEWSDEHCGDVVNYEIHSEQLLRDNKKTYPFIGDTFKMILSAEVFADEFWEKMEYQLDDADEDDYKQILRDFHAYGVPQEAIDQLIEMAEEYDEDLAEEMREILEAWENGEEVEISSSDIDTSNLPEGYMEMLTKIGKETGTLRYDDDDPDFEAEEDEDEEDE